MEGLLIFLKKDFYKDRNCRCSMNDKLEKIVY